MWLEANGDPSGARFHLKGRGQSRRNRPGNVILGQMLEDRRWLLVSWGAPESETIAGRSGGDQKKSREKDRHQLLDSAHQLALALHEPDDAAALVERYYGPVRIPPLSIELLKNLEARAEIALLRNDGKSAAAIAGRAVNAIASSPSGSI